MKTYRVEYRIDIDADSIWEAAQQAQIACLDPAYDSRVWTVTAENGEETNVYLFPDGTVADDDGRPLPEFACS